MEENLLKGSRKFLDILLVSILMVIASFAVTFFSAHAQASDGSDSPIAATIGDPVEGELLLQSESNIKIIAPDDIAGWLLDPSLGDMNTKTGTLLVKCNKRWMVQVADAEFDYSSADPAPPKEMGYMTEYDLGDPPGYVIDPKKLESPMSVSATTEGTTRKVDLSVPEGGLLAMGSNTHGLSDKTDEVEVTFWQPTSWDDAVLQDEDHSYHIVITITVSAID